MLSPHARVCEKWHCSQNVPPHAKPAGAGDALSSTADALRFSLASHAACITSCLDTQARPSALSTRSLSIRCTFARSCEAAAPSALSTRSLRIRCVFPRCITAFLPSSKRRDEAAGAAVTAEARGTGGAEDFPAAAVSRAPVSYHEATRAASNFVTQTNSAKPTDRMKKEVRREMSNWIRLFVKIGFRHPSRWSKLHRLHGEGRFRYSLTQFRSFHG